MMGPTGTICTIGHSNHPLEHFIGLIEQHGINTLCDVRSVPYSRINPQFNRETLKAALLKEGITYVFLGQELGARAEDPSCYIHGKVQFDCLAGTALFQRGIDTLIETMRTCRLAIMCAEKDPLDCHRTILVSRRLAARGVAVGHILPDGAVETHAQAVARLLRQLHIPETGELFRSREDIISDAYRIQGERIAYVKKTTPDADAGRIRRSPR
jgi:uncharacterized protein (DUF488 family)